MNELKTLRKSDLQNLEHYQFAFHLLTMAKEANVEKLGQWLPFLERALAAEDEALNPKKANMQEEPLRELDNRRVNGYKALQHAVKMGKHSEDVAEQEATKVLTEIMSRYPGIVRMNFDKKTGGLSNLVTDLAEPEAVKALKTLHAETIVKRIANRNKAFDEAFMRRFKEDKKQFNMKKLRQDTDKAIAVILRAIDALDFLEPSENITQLISRYNQLVDNRRALLKQRKMSRVKTATAKAEEQREMLKPMFDNLAKQLGTAAVHLHYTGRSVGSGARKYYELRVDDHSDCIWVRRVRKRLVKVASADLPKAAKRSLNREWGEWGIIQHKTIDGIDGMIPST